MGSRRRETFGTRAIATPLLLIVGLLALHLVASDWNAIPRLISSTLAAIQ